MNPQRERERKKEKRFSATTRGAERIERKKNSFLSSSSQKNKFRSKERCRRANRCTLRI
ncbi:hypothetical protein N9D57_01770 [bacterium]|nr:hypothetical protein [bacterium]